MSIHNSIELLVEKIIHGKKNIVFTGAGVSTESGINDYKSQGGNHERSKTLDYHDFLNSESARINAWAFERQRYERIQRAAVNSGHAAIYELYKMNLLETVITQNIDGLHQKSGIPVDKVVELHGNIENSRCLKCNKVYKTGDALKFVSEANPGCKCACGGFIKTDIVYFGENLSEQTRLAAFSLIQGCSVFIVVGSTLTVQPAAYLPVFARDNNAFLAIINLSETPCDKMSQVVIRGKAGIILPEIVKIIKG